jgi:hypothetical protein
MDMAQDTNFVSEKLNINPDFFGDITVAKDDRIVFTTDERGRILTQTLYDDEENIIWEIKNTWSRDRIASMTKKDSEIELLSEYEYDSAGNRILERNYRNGILERVVRTDKNRDIEELYMNDRVILTAVYEDGRKISESRMRNN